MLYFDDSGFAGKSLDCPSIQALMQEIKLGNIDVVVAYKIDRITCYLPDFYEFWKILNQHKVHFVSATQSFDTGTPMGLLMLNMLLSFGQFEREMIAERVQQKVAERVKKGMWNGGWAPLGYSHDSVAKQINPDPTEAPLVKRIFELSKELRSPAKVANLLNAEGLRTPVRSVQSRRGNEMMIGGKRFIPNKIKLIVPNPIYKGIVRHNGEDHAGQHAALISKKLWQKANDAFDKKSRPKKATMGNRNVHEALLKGLIRCGVCSHRLTPKAAGKKDKDGNPYVYYTCNNVNKDGKAATCSLRSIPAHTMDEFILGILGEIGRHPEVIKAAISAANSERNKSIRPLKSKLAKLQKRHAEITSQLQRYLDLARKTDSAHFGRETLAAAEDLAKQKQEMDREIEKLKIDIAYREEVVTDEAVIAKALLTFENTMKVLPFEDQRELLQLLVKGIRVDRLDPKKDKIPGTPGTWSTQIRTQWYVANLEIYATDLISGTYENCTLSSHSKQTGGAGVSDLRTSFGISMTLGVPLPQYNLSPFVESPFRLALKMSGPTSPRREGRDVPLNDQKHPICKVLEWQKHLHEDSNLSKVQIAEQEGISKSRMTQMFRLLNLTPEAQDYLARLNSPNLIRAFSVRKLMQIAKMPFLQKESAFNRLRLACESSV